MIAESADEYEKAQDTKNPTKYCFDETRYASLGGLCRWKSFDITETELKQRSFHIRQD